MKQKMLVWLVFSVAWCVGLGAVLLLVALADA